MLFYCCSFNAPTVVSTEANVKKLYNRRGGENRRSEREQHEKIICSMYFNLAFPSCPCVVLGFCDLK